MRRTLPQIQAMLGDRPWHVVLKHYGLTHALAVLSLRRGDGTVLVLDCAGVERLELDVRGSCELVVAPVDGGIELRSTNGELRITCAHISEGS